MQQKREAEQQQQLQHQRDTEIGENNKATGETTNANKNNETQRNSKSMLNKLKICLKKEKPPQNIPVRNLCKFAGLDTTSE